MPKSVMDDKRRIAVTSVFVLILIPVILGFAALTVDVGVMFNTKADLQRSADAAALAAIEVLAHGEDYPNPLAAATQAAIAFVQSNHVSGHVVTIDPGVDLVFGRAAHDSIANTYTFTPGDVPTNAIRVFVRHTADSPNGQSQLYFANILGVGATDISAQAAATFVGSRYDEQDCTVVPAAGKVVLCAPVGDCGVDSDDSGSMGGDDSDSDSLDPPGDSDDDSDDSDDSATDSTDCFSEDSESGPSGAGSLHTIVVDANAAPGYLADGATEGPCACMPGDADDSDDSEAGGSDDSDDSGGGAVSNKVKVCHVSATHPANSFVLTVEPGPQLADHMSHGDTLGDCPGQGTLRVFLFE